MKKLILSAIDYSIRKPYKNKDWWCFIIKTFEHIKNDGGSGDKYLVVFQPHQGVKWIFNSDSDFSVINDIDNNLPKVESLEEMALVLEWWDEFSELLMSWEDE